MRYFKYAFVLSVLMPSLVQAGVVVTGGGANIYLTIFNGSSPLNGSNAGDWINGLQISTINCGSGMSCSDGGNGIFNLTATGGGGGGGSSLFLSSSEARFGNSVSSLVIIGISSIGYQNNLATITVHIPPGYLASSHTSLNFWTSTRGLAGFISVALSTTANRAEWNVSKSTADLRIQQLSLDTGTLMSFVSISISTTQAAMNRIYPATATPQFPFGLSAATATVPAASAT